MEAIYVIMASGNKDKLYVC